MPDATTTKSKDKDVNALKLRYMQVAGGLGLAGSSVLILNGDTKSFAATGLFIAGQALAISKGRVVPVIGDALKDNEKLLYSSCAVLFASGDAALVLSDTTNLGTKLTVGAIGAGWALGTLRAPFDAVAKRTSGRLSEALNSVVSKTPAIVGNLSAGLRVPVVAAALYGQNYATASAFTLFFAADNVLAHITTLDQRDAGIEEIIPYFGDRVHIEDGVCYVPIDMYKEDLKTHKDILIGRETQEEESTFAPLNEDDCDAIEAMYNPEVQEFNWGRRAASQPTLTPIEV